VGWVRQEKRIKELEELKELLKAKKVRTKVKTKSIKIK